jgi:hypothetical protein
MVREWEETLREINLSIETTEASLECDLQISGSDDNAVEDKPDLDILMDDLRDLATFRAQRDLLTELLRHADALSKKELPD